MTDSLSYIHRSNETAVRVRIIATFDQEYLSYTWILYSQRLKLIHINQRHARLLIVLKYISLVSKPRNIGCIPE